jgi:hypothetical protein
MIGGDGTAAVNPETGLAAYESTRKQAGRDADAHVRLALWCEAQRLPAERVKQLALAILYDPSHGLARALLGLMPHKGKWERPDEVGQKIQTDPEYKAVIREYLDLRMRTPSKPDAQMKLAGWCEQKGLKAQAVAHYNEVLRLDPSRDSAWRRLGYKKYGSFWIKPDELAARKEDAERQKQADKHWRPKLEKLRDGLENKDAGRRRKAEAAVLEVSDLRAVPMIWAVFVTGHERRQLAAVQMLGQIDGPAASTSLAALAVFSGSGQVRGRAISTLARRDPRDVVDRLIEMVRKPFKYQVRPVNGPGSPSELFVEGEKFNIRRLYAMAPVDPNQIPARIFAPSVPFNPFSLPNLLTAMGGAFGSTPAQAATAAQAAQAMSENPQGAAAIVNQLVGFQSLPGANPANNLIGSTLAIAAQRDMQIAAALENIRQSSAALQQRLASDIQAVEATNAEIKALNERALPVLLATTGKDLGAEPEKWKNWWTDQLGYAYQSSLAESKPTFTDMVVMSSQPPSSACFGAGTLVRALEGLRPIESIQVGDRVLSQNSTTGLLAFQPVVAIHRSKPTATMRVAVDGETIIATGIHRMWQAGKGWTMARDLKAGDRLRTLGGVTTVRSVETGETQPVYNLDVAENRDFLVGSNGVLVHDFSFVQPVLAPFDRQLELAPRPVITGGDAGK